MEKINADQFQSTVLEASSPVLVDFSAAWCGPCKVLEPVLEQVAEGFAGKVKFVKVDIDESSAVATKYAVTNVPTLVLFKGGEEAGRKVGGAPKPALEGWIRDTAQVS